MNNNTIFGILVVIIIIIFLMYFLRVKEDFSYDPYNGRNPNGPPLCCGNLDWYLGDDYKKYCGNIKPTAFQNTRTIEGFDFSSEMMAKDAMIGKLDFDKLNNECQSANPSWRAAYNPMICTEESKVIAEANCKCMNERNQCAKCYDKIDLSKYLG